jgi:hypothetical protein
MTQKLAICAYLSHSTRLNVLHDSSPVSPIPAEVADK